MGTSRIPEKTQEESYKKKENNQHKTTKAINSLQLKKKA